jgi:hypothetical protein
MQAARASRDMLEGISLSSLFDVALRTRADGLLVRTPDAGERGGWTAAELNRRAERLAALLSLSRLPERSHALIMLPHSHQSLTALLACLRIGFRPVMLSLGLAAERIQHIVDTSGPSLAIGTSAAGGLNPALMLRDAAARSFNARLICSFGEQPPDGAVPLDAVLNAQNAMPPVRSLIAAPETLTVAAETAHGARVVASEAELVQGAVEIARAASVNPGQRVVSLMMGHEPGALSSGVYLSLLTGAEMLPVGVFSLSALWAALSDGKPVCLAAPASIEDALAAAGLLDHDMVRSVVFIHDTPLAEELPPSSGRVRVVDAHWTGAALSVQPR